MTTHRLFSSESFLKKTLTLLGSCRHNPAAAASPNSDSLGEGKYKIRGEVKGRTPWAASPSRDVRRSPSFSLQEWKNQCDEGRSKKMFFPAAESGIA